MQFMASLKAFDFMIVLLNGEHNIFFIYIEEFAVNLL